MKQLILAFCVWLAGLPACFAEPLSLVTYNLHYISERQTEHRWEDRRDAVVQNLQQLQPDLMLFQEMETFAGGSYNRENRQLADVLAHFPEFAATAVGDPQKFPSTQPVLYRRDRFEPGEQGFFFFSPTPDEIYARPWENRFSAFAVWVQLYDRQNGESFYVVNIHTDYSSSLNRRNSAGLIAQRIQPWLQAGAAVIVAGDFNAFSWWKSIDILQQAGLQLADRDGATFHFYRGLRLLPAIDHVMYSGFEQQGPTLTLKQRVNGVWGSDHFPLRVVLELAGAG